MSSIYRLICMNHDPALVLDDIDFGSADSVLLALTVAEGPVIEMIERHAKCDLVVGRWSGALIEVACPGINVPASHRGAHGKAYGLTDNWTDVGWLQLLGRLHADAPELAGVRLPSCWPHDRAVRLAELIEQGRHA